MKISFWTALAAALISIPVFAKPDPHAFNGVVSRVTPGTIELSVNGETLQFTRKGSSDFEPRVGEQVTIWSDLTVQKMRRGAPAQPGQRGQSSPNPEPSVIDDRAFYYTSNEKPPVTRHQLPGT